MEVEEVVAVEDEVVDGGGGEVRHAGAGHMKVFIEERERFMTAVAWLRCGGGRVARGGEVRGK